MTSAKTGTFPLRLPVSLKAAIEEMAAREGISMNQFLVLAAAEKLSAMHTAERFFAERRGQGNPKDAIAFLKRQGGEPVREGDELSE